MTQEDINVIVERLKNFQEENNKSHERLIAQTTKTNGSVAEIKMWQERIIGAITILSAVILPIFISVVIKFVISNIWN
jgi:Mg2+ and Co2+ transporter CorA